jgi:S-DNA-T family DNA segregation ATPase FtsK/SpoIIIE
LDAFRAFDAKLPLILGIDPAGKPVIADLAHMPNLLVAAASRADKQGAIDAVVLALVCRHAPGQCGLMLIDAGARRPSPYEGLPHLLSPIATDPGDGLAALDWIAAEMDERLGRMARLGVGNIDVYNNRVGHGRRGGDAGPLSHIVVVIEELAELVQLDRFKVESIVQRLHRKARAAGIHLVVATQRPSPDVVTAALKKAFPTRAACKLASTADSCTVLDAPGAEQVRGEGDMLWWSGSDRIVRVRRPIVAEEEVAAIVACLRGQSEPRYV